MRVIIQAISFLFYLFEKKIASLDKNSLFLSNCRKFKSQWAIRKKLEPIIQKYI